MVPWPPSLPTLSQFLSLLLLESHGVRALSKPLEGLTGAELGLKVISHLSSGPPPLLTLATCSSHRLLRSHTLPLPAQPPPEIHSCPLESPSLPHLHASSLRHQQPQPPQKCLCPLLLPHHSLPCQPFQAGSQGFVRTEN